MPKYIRAVHADAAPAVVWPLVSDVTKHAEWSADPLTVTPTGEFTYDTVARAKGKEFRARVEVLDVVPEKRVVFRAIDATGTYEHTISLTPEGTGTRITREISATGLSFGQRLLFYVVLYPVKIPSATKSLRRLAAQLS